MTERDEIVAKLEADLAKAAEETVKPFTPWQARERVRSRMQDSMAERHPGAMVSVSEAVDGKYQVWVRYPAG